LQFEGPPSKYPSRISQDPLSVPSSPSAASSPSCPSFNCCSPTQPQIGSRIPNFGSLFACWHRRPASTLPFTVATVLKVGGPPWPLSLGPRISMSSSKEYGNPRPTSATCTPPFIGSLGSSSLFLSVIGFPP
jgi:hypothetical protein